MTQAGARYGTADRSEAAEPKHVGASEAKATFSALIEGV